MQKGRNMNNIFNHLDLNLNILEGNVLQKKTPFPLIFTSFAFTSKEIKTHLGVNDFKLNRILAAISRIGLNMLLKIHHKLLSLKSFAPYLKAKDNPYMTVINGLVVTLMLGKSAEETQIKLFLSKVQKVVKPLIPDIIRIHSPYDISQDSANLAYYQLMTMRAKVLKSLKSAADGDSKQVVIEDITIFLRSLVYELRLVKCMY